MPTKEKGKFKEIELFYDDLSEEELKALKVIRKLAKRKREKAMIIPERTNAIQETDQRRCNRERFK